MKRGGKSKKSENEDLPRHKMPLDNNKMGDFADLDPTEGEITPETDGLEQNPGERLEFGFSFSAEEGRIGEENEYYGDMTKEQKAVGNIYDPTMDTGRARIDVDDQQVGNVHITDEDHIGMAYGKDKYVDDTDKKAKNVGKKGGPGSHETYR